MPQKLKYFQYINNINPKEFSDFICVESTQLIAIILLHLEKNTVKSIMDNLEEETKIEVYQKMLNINKVEEKIIEDISNELEKKLKFTQNKLYEIKNDKMIKELVNTLPAAIKKQII